jgi:hypothetical protein
MTKQTLYLWEVPVGKQFSLPGSTDKLMILGLYDEWESGGGVYFLIDDDRQLPASTVVEVEW